MVIIAKCGAGTIQWEPSKEVAQFMEDMETKFPEAGHEVINLLQDQMAHFATLLAGCACLPSKLTKTSAVVHSRLSECAHECMSVAGIGD